MKTLLLIEDNSELRENTFELLELEGYNVVAVDNGIKGLALAKEKLPDIILCDIWMPGISGYDVLTELKNNAETSRIPFVFFTASAEKSEVEAGLGMGADGYIRKPFDAEELYEMIARLVDGE